MALREILKFPDPRLKQVANPVETITDELRELAQDMCEAMYDEPGIGLAAPQVGEALRLFVIDTEWNDEDTERNAEVLINPEFIKKEGKTTWEEGCLSVPDYTAEVERASEVTVRALNLEGEEVTYECTGLKAICMQHENDHLDGILFIDRISRLKRSLYVKKRKKKLAAEAAE